MSAPIDKTFIREYELYDDNVLKIHQSEIGDVGCVVWDAALVLSKYLERVTSQKHIAIKDKSVVELGAGTGVVGLVAGSLGANVTITDLPEFVPLINKNIEENKELLDERVRAAEFTWGHDQSPTNQKLDYILLADCIYYDESLEPLVKSLDDLCGEKTVIYCCYEHRDIGNKPQLEKRFFELVGELFDVTEIPLENQDQLYSSPDIHIMKFTRRPTG